MALDSDDADNEALAMARASAMGLSYVSKKNKRLTMRSSDLIKIIPEDFARQHAVFPLFHGNNVLAVALADPENVAQIEALKAKSGMGIQPYISTKAQILAAIDEEYQSRN